MMTLGGEVSFLGFLDILLLRCSPFAMAYPCVNDCVNRKMLEAYLTSITNSLRGRRIFFKFSNQS